MWNRVFLLASGFLLGWSLVRYWTVPRAQMRTHALRLGIAIAVGGAVIVLLGLESLQAAAAGVLVYAVSAVVAYAGNARQVNRVEEPPPASRPTPAGIDAPRRGVVLVSCLEPPTYEGPDYWAWRLRRREGHDGRAPHWFVRPRVFARIRSAYHTLTNGDDPNGSAPTDALGRVRQALEALLGGEYRVETARVGVPLALTRALADMAGDGVTHVLVQPLQVSPDAIDTVREAITHSRVREVGVRVTVADPLPVPTWDGIEGRLDAWMTGRPPSPPRDPDPGVLERLQSRLAEQA